ncbi:TPA: hypothetical protein EYP66_09155 [Candidatus Poribacteria bacterium]|nr:hypothetical protein [Candidatus Poribacteria bacterium]
MYGSPESVEDHCKKGHLVTAEQHRAMFEAVNHRMWDITSGFTEWKLNSCWPSVQLNISSLVLVHLFFLVFFSH